MNKTKSKSRSRLWLGVARDGSREIFRSVETPTQEKHGTLYVYTVGPFRTKAGAEYMRDHAHNNPHCWTVNQAEHIAKGQVYDIVLRKWINKRAAL